MKLLRGQEVRCVGLGIVATLLLGCAAGSRARLQAADHYRFAQSYLGVNSYSLAEQEIRKALTAQPDNPDYLGFLALIYQKQERLNPAEDAYRLALQQPDVPPSVLVNYSTLMLQRNRADEAITLAQRALQVSGYDKPARAYTSIGLAYLQKDLLAQALAHLRKALEYQPGLPEVHHNLGLVYNRLGQYLEAIQAFQEAIRLQPSYVWAYQGLGTVLLNVGRYAEAAQAFREAIRLQSLYIEAHHGLVKALLEDGHQAEAKIALERVMALDPDSRTSASLREQLKRATP